MSNKLSINDITEISLFFALSLILKLDFFKIRIGILSNVGSISLSFLPLFVIALRSSFIKSFIAFAFFYPVLLAMYKIRPPLIYLFDYILPITSFSIISIFRNKILSEKKSVSYSSLIFCFFIIFIFCLLSHTLSGCISYNSTFLNALYLDGLYVIGNGIVNVGILFFLIEPLKIINKKYQKESNVF